jgi:preprotein translocase subunit YajC
MPTDGTNIVQILFPYAVIFGIFYFLVFRPQKQKQDEVKAMISAVKKNDQVVTNSGIHGTVVNVKETTIVMRIDDNARMEVDKDAITTVKKS